MKRVMIEKKRLMLDLLKKKYKNAVCALRFQTPWELLVATILSAQCTDKRVNIVTKGLFSKYPDAASICELSVRKLEKEIHSTGFFRMKAKHIKETACIIQRTFNGEVPRTMSELLTLPGVARKTANIVLLNAYGIVEGIAVDTHVRRLSKRLGFTHYDNPHKIEQDLMALVARTDWGAVSHWLIEHGRAICDARRPRCILCILTNVCPSSRAREAV